MPWFKVDDRFHGSRKVKRIPKPTRLAAVGLWTLAGSWSAAEGLDGFIPDYMVEELGGHQKLVNALVEAGLWEIVPGGTQFHSWTKYNPDSASTNAMRGAKSEGGAHGNHLRWHVKRRLTVRGCQWCESPTDRISDSHSDQSSESGANPPGPTQPNPRSDDQEIHSSPSARDVVSAFDRAYAAWPKKAKRKESLDVFARKARARGLDALTADVIRYGSAYAAHTEVKLVPALCVWLRGERWDDDLPTPAAPSDAEWSAFLNGAPSSRGRPPTRTEQNMAVVAQISRQEECDAGRHVWVVDGTCNFCPAKRALEGVLP